MDGKIYVMDGGDLHALSKSTYDAEEKLQKLLRDHLFLDQDGIPTLVEVKRSANRELRQQVVGQMFDYAANAIRYGDVDRIRRLFREGHKEPEEKLSGHLGISDPEAYWKEEGRSFSSLASWALRFPPALRAERCRHNREASSRRHANTRGYRKGAIRLKGLLARLPASRTLGTAFSLPSSSLAATELAVSAAATATRPAGRYRHRIITLSGAAQGAGPALPLALFLDTSLRRESFFLFVELQPEF